MTNEQSGTPVSAPKAEQAGNGGWEFPVCIALLVVVIWTSFTFWPVKGGLEIIARLESLAVGGWAILGALCVLLWILRLFATADEQAARHQACVSDLRARNASTSKRN